jgi:glycosyltransferase involved in cell wall biosynthesis
VRLAFVSPLPPATSGIADYAAELVPHLAAPDLEIELFHPGPTPPAALAQRLRCRPVRELGRAAASFDLVLYQIGNSAPHHGEILDILLEVPGAVVLHEYVLHHLWRERTLVAGDPRGYVEAMRYCAGESGRRAAQRLLDTHYPVDVWSFPLFERVVDRSRAVLVHSEFAARRVRASRPDADLRVLPFPVELPAPAPDAAARRRLRDGLGLPPDGPLLATFGLVTPQKRLGPALAAFARWRRERPDANFLIAGEVSPHYDLDALLAENGRDGVHVAGRLAPERFAAATGAADVAVNLRHPTGGETSASLLRLLAAGVATIVSRAGSFAELPPGAAAQVALDEREEDHLLALFRALGADPDLRAALGAAGRRHVERVHALPGAAAPWRAALADLARRPAAVAATVPPLAPWDGVDPRVALAAGVGADLADLGIGAGDTELLEPVAAALAELDCAPRGTPRR